jgi:hypothetical protein
MERPMDPTTSTAASNRTLIDEREIEEYLAAVKVHLVGPPMSVDRCLAEIRDHLEEEVGHLDPEVVPSFCDLAVAHFGDPEHVGRALTLECALGSLAGVAKRLATWSFGIAFAVLGTAQLALGIDRRQLSSLERWATAAGVVATLCAIGLSWWSVRRTRTLVGQNRSTGVVIAACAVCALSSCVAFTVTTSLAGDLLADSFRHLSLIVNVATITVIVAIVGGCVSGVSALGSIRRDLGGAATSGDSSRTLPPRTRSTNHEKIED